MSTLEKLSTELKDVRLTARRELSEFAPNTQPGWAARISAAKTRVKTLEYEYAKKLFQNGFGIFLTGDVGRQLELAELVKKAGEGLTVSSDGLYREVIGPTVEKSVGKKREWIMDHTGKVQELLREWMHKNQVTSAALPIAREGRAVPDYDAVVKHIKKLIEKGNGQTLNILYLERQLRDEALAMAYGGKTVPILFVRAPEEAEQMVLAKALAMKGSTVVDVNQFEGKKGTDFLASVFKAAQKKGK